MWWDKYKSEPLVALIDINTTLLDYTVGHTSSRTFYYTDLFQIPGLAKAQFYSSGNKVIKVIFDQLGKFAWQRVRR